jgi:hypothetical protein
VQKKDGRQLLRAGIALLAAAVSTTRLIDSTR